MKVLIILPLVAALSACSFTDRFSESGKNITKNTTKNTAKKVVIEDKKSNQVPAIIGEQSSFKWHESNEPSTVIAMPAQERESVLTTLKASNTQFILYFDFNATKINQDAMQEIIKHVQFMQENPQIRLRLEGHADARGTREYNLALAENRALRIKEVMDAYVGIDNRISVVSYGEEKPVSKIENEAGWQRNRRVEFVYE